MRSARLLVALSLVIAGCPTFPEPILCGQIPEGGCPAGRGGTCDDPVCDALYNCLAGRWEMAQRCADADAGAPPDGGPGDGGGPCTPVSIDTSAQKTGCQPDLQDPDCPVEAAMGCRETVCFTGCSDFFLCTKDGWIDVAYCTEDGDFILAP